MAAMSTWIERYHDPIPPRTEAVCSARSMQKGESRSVTMTRRYSLTLDLKQDPALIAEYRKYHEDVWPEVIQSIKDAGIEDMEIYLLGTRLFMIMEVNESFSFEKKARADQANPKVQEWEKLMWKFQEALPQAKPGEKWLPMERIFKLKK